MDCEIFLWKARASQRHGDLEGALRASEAYLEYRPNSVTAYQMIGRYAEQLGRPSQAAAALRRAAILRAEGEAQGSDHGGDR